MLWVNFPWDALRKYCRYEIASNYTQPMLDMHILEAHNGAHIRMPKKATNVASDCGVAVRVAAA